MEVIYAHGSKPLCLFAFSNFEIVKKNCICPSHNGDQDIYLLITMKVDIPSLLCHVDVTYQSYMGDQTGT